MSQALLDRAVQLRAAVKRHKAAIRQHREQLGATVAELQQVERDCRRLGIALVEVAPPAAGSSEGR